MNTRRNHPRGVLLDLLNDMVARLDDLLSQLAANADAFTRELKADRSQHSRSPFTQHVLNTTMPTDQTPSDQTSSDQTQTDMLPSAGGQPPQSIHQLLLELHQMHGRLAEIIRELEEREGLG